MVAVYFAVLKKREIRNNLCRKGVVSDDDDDDSNRQREKI